MAWNNTPKAPDIILTTQSPIQENYESFKQAFEVNHKTLDHALQGVHTKADFLRIDDDTLIGTPGLKEILLYNHSDGGQNTLRVRRSTGVDYPISRRFKSLTELTSGFIIKSWSFTFNFIVAPGEFDIPVTFIGRAFTQIPYALFLSVQLGPTTPQTLAFTSYSDLTVNGFTAHLAFANSARQTGFPVYYLAIGI